MFFVFGIDEMLWVGGCGMLLVDLDLFVLMVEFGKLLCVVFDFVVSEVYFYCGKVLMCLKLWLLEKVECLVMLSIVMVIYD